jgi:Rad3-related DNA helicase
MEFDLTRCTAALSVGEFAAFTLGPHNPGSGSAGLWRAQLGTHWHNELRTQASSENPAATFEVAITGRVAHRGWTLTLTGRIDQVLPPADTCHIIDDKLPFNADVKLVALREIKTVMRPLPAHEPELRTAYPEYFTQAAAYLTLRRLEPNAAPARAELLFVEASSGLAQLVALTPADEVFFRTQLERVTEFLNLRKQARDRLQHLRFRPAFTTPRPGQEETQAQLTAAFARTPAVLFEAPTGFGKTGVLLEFALGQLRAGQFERVLYLTSKSTGQLQVVRQLAAMTAPPNQCHAIGDTGPGAENTSRDEATTPVASWHVRNKQEHCVNHTFHCVRGNCRYLDSIEARWPESGLARFYRIENQARDLESLRTAGREARICPYEITRAALAFNEVWIGDYNYVFSPANHGLFYLQPGFKPARTLLIVDEAHNLPSRVADAHSHVLKADEARALLAELDHLEAPTPLLRAWESLVQLLAALPAADLLDPALEADVAETLAAAARELAIQPLDYAALGPVFSDLLWRIPTLAEWLKHPQLTKLLWCPRPAELAFTCIDAAPVIGASLGDYGGVILASATLNPTAEFIENIGLAEGGVRNEECRIPIRDVPNQTYTAPASTPHSAFLIPHSLIATTTWRDGAYNVAVDARVDTTFQHRSQHFATTAQTVLALHTAARGPVVVFFPSYVYAESIERTLADMGNPLRVGLQPRLHDLAAQTTWVEDSLAFTDALFLVLGSSFAESIDLLGGRISHAMVVGPALPEVNAVQRARIAEFSPLGREAAFRRVYQIPGMQKVNQALGRLVRAPGQRAKVLLHCRRFAEISYARLLAKDYQFGPHLVTDAELSGWLKT